MKKEEGSRKDTRRRARKSSRIEEYESTKKRERKN